MPTATAARASTGAMARSPPVLVPWPPGRCTEWVASKMTRWPACRIGGQPAHVDDEIVIAEGRAALGDEVILAAAGAELGRDVVHVVRREELALLDVDRASALRRGEEQIGLAAKEGGDLQDVDDLGGGLDLRDVVDVGQDRTAEASS